MEAAIGDLILHGKDHVLILDLGPVLFDPWGNCMNPSGGKR
jgi:hypothetical protein